MNEKVQDFRGHSPLLIGYKAERPGKHTQDTSAFSLGILIPHCLYGPGTYPNTPAVARERKGPKHVRQKQHRTGTVLALSSRFLNGKHEGKWSRKPDESAP